MNNKIRILYTVPNFNTAGSGRVVFKICSLLNKGKFEPEICCLHRKGEFYQTVKKSGIPVHVFPYISNQTNILKNIKNIYATSSFFKQRKVDVIHSMNYMSEFTEPIAAKWAGVPWVYSKNNMSWGRKRWHIRTLLSKAVFAQNTTMIKSFYQNNPKVHWVTDGVDMQEFKKQDAKPELIQELGISPTKNLITVANLVPIKKIELLINAFYNLSREFKLCKLIIVGSDKSEYATKLKSQVHTLNLSERIIFTGKKMNVIDYLNTADIFVLPTDAIGEGSPVALMEAMSAKLYAIGSNVPGIDDQLKGLSDHLFKANDVNDLTDKLKIALNKNTNDFRNDISMQFAKISNKFDIVKEIHLLENTYQKLIKK